MSVPANELMVGRTYKLGDRPEFTVGSVDVEPRAPMANGIQRFYYTDANGNEIVTKQGEMYTLVKGGGRRRKSRKARRAQKKRTRRSRR